METTTLKMFSDTVKNEKGMIWITPVCEFFNLHVQNQYSKIKNDPILGKLHGKNHTDLENNDDLYGKNIPDFGEIDKNGRILLSRKGFLRWIQIINPNTIPEDFRDTFILYQGMVADFLFGSVEEHETISLVNHELQQWKERYSEAGTMIRKKQAELTLLLNSRYQYRIDFKQDKILTQ